jgi:hypothetical protein
MAYIRRFLRHREIKPEKPEMGVEYLPGIIQELSLQDRITKRHNPCPRLKAGIDAWEAPLPTSKFVVKFTHRRDCLSLHNSSKDIYCRDGPGDRLFFFLALSLFTNILFTITIN